MVPIRHVESFFHVYFENKMLFLVLLSCFYAITNFLNRQDAHDYITLREESTYIVLGQ